MTTKGIRKEMQRKILALLFPQRCPGCDRLFLPEERSAGYCSACRKEITPLADNFCMRCGREISDGEYCASCAGGKEHRFVAHRGIYPYRGKMKGSMYRFKYSNRRTYADSYAKDAASLYGYWLRHVGVEAIVPVPMYPQKKRARGYNQAEVFAVSLGEVLGLPVYTNYLVRCKNTKPQKNLSDTQRKINLKNAFKIGESIVKLRHVLVVDDIYTTGSTMDGVAEVLLASGVEDVYCLSVCIGESQGG